MRPLLALVPALFLGACMGASEPPVAAQAPVQAVPVAPVTASALPPPTGGSVATGGSVTTTARASAAPAPTSASTSQIAMSPSMSTATMQRAPGARESAGVQGVSQSRSGAATGSGMGGTIVGGQSAGLIPAVVDRNREPVSRRSTAPRDPLGPGTPPPVIQPEMREQMGNSLRNRQRVDF